MICPAAHLVQGEPGERVQLLGVAGGILGGSALVMQTAKVWASGLQNVASTTDCFGEVLYFRGDKREREGEIEDPRGKGLDSIDIVCSRSPPFLIASWHSLGSR